MNSGSNIAPEETADSAVAAVSDLPFTAAAASAAAASGVSRLAMLLMSFETSARASGEGQVERIVVRVDSTSVCMMLFHGWARKTAYKAEKIADESRAWVTASVRSTAAATSAVASEVVMS